MVKISTKDQSGRTLTKSVRTGAGRSKTPEPTARGRVKYVANASQVCNRYVGQPRREKLPSDKAVRLNQTAVEPVMVPVLSSLGKPLMPTRPLRAKELLKSKRAIRRWFKGIFAIQMLDRAEGSVQQVACGIDPGSKREAMTIQSKQHTYLNVLSDAVTWVKDRVEVRRIMRRARRFRKLPCRTPRANRFCNSKRLPPSTKSRWQAKLRIINFLRKLYPITDYVVEDIKAKTWKGSKKWNKSFSPLEVGKAWFYDEVSKLGNLITKQGWETSERRNLLGFKKSLAKMAETFDAHNVDSWVLTSFVTGKSVIDNKTIFRIIPLQLHRRQLHRFEPDKGGVRGPYGGTLSMGMKRGSVVHHTQLGRVYIGGTTRGKVSLHDLITGERLTKCGSIKDCSFLHFNSWRTSWVDEYGLVSSNG